MLCLLRDMDNPWPRVPISFQHPDKNRANVPDGLAWLPGQVEVGGGCPLLLALARALDLLPHLDRDTLLAVAELLVAVLSENKRTSLLLCFLSLSSSFSLTCWMCPDGHYPLMMTPSLCLSSSCPRIQDEALASLYSSHLQRVC